jgi:type I restriction enzyme M protein
MRNDAGVDGDAQRISQIVWLLFLKVYDAKEQAWALEDDSYISIIPEELQWHNWAVDSRDGEALTGDGLLELVNIKLFPALKKLRITKETPLKNKIVFWVFEDAINYMKDGVLLRQVINVLNEVDFDDYKDLHAFGEIYETLLKSLQSAGNAGEFYTPRAVTDFMVQMINPQLHESVADFACGTGGFLTSALRHKEKFQKTAEDILTINNSIYGIEKKPLPYLLCMTNMLLHGLDEPQIHHMNSLERNVREYKDDEKFGIILMNPPYGGGEKEIVKQNFPAALRSSETADLFMALIMYRLKAKGRCAVILPDGFLFGNDTAKRNLKEKLLNEFNLHTIVRMPGSVFAPYTSITTNILFFDKDANGTRETWFYRMDKPKGYKHFSKTKPILLEHFSPVIEWWNERKEIVDDDGNYKSKAFTKAEIVDKGYDLDQCKFPQSSEEILEPDVLIKNYFEQKEHIEENIKNVLSEIMTLLEKK